MSFSDIFSGFIKKPVGNNKDNNPNDVIKTKENFACEGRYKKPIENGYIDKELDTAIRQFQEDSDLKQDGYMNPKGETETKLKETVEANPTNKNVKLVSAGTVPTLALKLAPLLGVTAITAWDYYQKQNPATKKKLRDQANQQNMDNNGPDCENIYKRNTETCNLVTQSKGAAAGTICHASAANILGACSAKKPTDQWPPLIK